MSPWGSLAQRDLDAVEDMDRPDCDLHRLNRSYARFPVVNALLSGWHRMYRERFVPLLRLRDSVSVLDIGCGGGDVARSLARWALRDGFDLRVTAIDPDERAFAFASKARSVPGVEYRQALSSDLVAEGRTFHIVLSNHMLHHLDAADLAAILGDSEQLATSMSLHNDLRRSNAAYALFAAGFWPLGVGSFICGDGLVSIRRSYTPSELRAVAPAGWRVEPNGPWHNLLVREAPSEDGGERGA
ncbi:class I SAM-dependent methyltransferase [Paenarthrobacter sp. NPDC089989]|uniref:class I SAM-dependent methyltransferase n=1 Tax=unclassified Paenarthrobacter TaxID=2634190 RepID=UPI0037FA29D7